jgi:hypothetical protein
LLLCLLVRINWFVCCGGGVCLVDMVDGCVVKVSQRVFWRLIVRLLPAIYGDVRCLVTLLDV